MEFAPDIPWTLESPAGTPGYEKIPAALAAGMEKTDLTYSFVMVQTTADFGVV
jgi:hypothetical protein